MNFVDKYAEKLEREEGVTTKRTRIEERQIEEAVTISEVEYYIGKVYKE